MSDPISFEAKSPRFGLPFLYAGQTQREFFVNEAHALVDFLLHPVVEGQANTPPDHPPSGSCWIVGTSPAGAWLGREGQIACFQAGAWLFANPAEGMTVLDKTSGTQLRYLTGWRSAASVSAPMGGATVDVEARAAIAALVEALDGYGMIARTS